MRKKSGSSEEVVAVRPTLHGLLKGAYNRMEASGRLQNGGSNCVVVSQIHTGESEKTTRGK